MPIKKAVILLSGGLDSAVTLYYARNEGYRLTALIFNYGQRHKKEIQNAKKIVRLNRIPYYEIKIPLSWVKSALTSSKVKVPQHRSLKDKNIPVTYVSGRNIIFLSYAFSFAESIGAKYIFIGAHIHDYSGYPDCRPIFLNYFQRAVNYGMKDSRIKIIAPLIDKDKQQIVKLGIALNVPFQYTWSCYQGGQYPCGLCDSCRFRLKAFKSIGLNDPALVTSLNHKTTAKT